MHGRLLYILLGNVLSLSSIREMSMETPQQMPMDICIFIKSVKSLCLTDSNVECHSIFTPHAYILDDDEAVRKRMMMKRLGRG